MPCCSIPIIPRILSFDHDLVPPQIRDTVDQLNFVFPINTSNKIIFILCNIFDPIPGEKVNIQNPVKRIEVLIPIIIWRKFGQMLLPDPGWNLLKLKIDELNTEVAFFDPSLAVSHWFDSVCRLCRFHFYPFYISICRNLWQSWTGRGSFYFGISMQSRAGILLWASVAPDGFPEKAFNILLDFRQRLLNPDIWHPQRLLNSKIWNHQRILSSKI